MTSKAHERPNVTVPELARSAAIEATAAYVREVRDGTWPDDAHSYH